MRVLFAFFLIVMIADISFVDEMSFLYVFVIFNNVFLSTRAIKKSNTIVVMIFCFYKNNEKTYRL